MEPSSLAFVAIIGVWAAYLVPHWLRRREELAQSRTPDRFSSGLRVLQRRVRSRRHSHRSGDAVLTSPRVVVDTDGELLYVPGPRSAASSSSAVSPSAVHVSASPKVSSLMVSSPAASLKGATVDDTELPAAVVPAAVVVPADVPATRVPAADVRAAGTSRDLASALASARRAARRRAVVLLGLFVVTVGAGVTVPALTAPSWVVAPSAALLLLHLIASRRAAIRSSERLAVLTERARVVPVVARAAAGPAAATGTARVARTARPARVARPARPATAAQPAVAAAAASAASRAERRAMAAGAETWEPIPVPVPTYTLKPAVLRPEPPPLDLPAAAVTRPAGSRPAIARPGTRGSLPRRAEDIERILALDADPLRLQERTAVNS